MLSQRRFQFDEVSALEIESYVDQPDQSRNFHQRADYGCECGARIDAKDGYRNRDGEFKVIACGRKRQGNRLAVVSPSLSAHKERHKEHHGEINQQRNCYSDNVKGNLYDIFTLEREHNKYSKQQRNQSDRADTWNKNPLIPFLPL